MPSGARPPPQVFISSSKSSLPKAAQMVCAQLYMHGGSRKVESAFSAAFMSVLLWVLDEVAHALSLGIQIVLVIIVSGDADGHLLFNAEAVAGETHDFAGVVGEQA